MTDADLQALRDEMRAGFLALNERLDGVTAKVDSMNAKADAGFSDVRLGLYSVMAKLLAPAEVSSIRARMEGDARA